MANGPARERLNRLVELAAENGIAARRELTSELADLLLDWPSSYPEAMREPFEALLEKALVDIGPEARRLLAERFVQRSGVPLSVLNALIFDASPEARAAILARNASAAHAGDLSVASPSEAALLSKLRRAQLAEIAAVLSEQLGFPASVAQQVLADVSATGLALLCKGADLSRATFSALAVLARPFAETDEHYRRLAVFDEVPEEAARALLRFWQDQAQPQCIAASDSG